MAKTNSNNRLEIFEKYLDFFFQNLRDRWEIGLKNFIRQINIFCDSYDKTGNNKIKLKERDIVNTPIHNVISLEGAHIFVLLDSIFMQRLRGIHHQGLAYLVYPTATHSRFEHSLGAYKITNDIIKSMKEKDKKNFNNCEFDENHLLIAALLHDIGHYPFSHIGEKIFDDFIKKNELWIPELKNYFPENHEARGSEILCGDDIFPELNEFLKEEQKDIIKSEDCIEKLFKKLGIETQKICSLIGGIKKTEDELLKIKNNHNTQLKNEIIQTRVDKTPIIELKHLINGPLDVDKLDYILREAYFTGTPFGNIDIHRIIKGYAIGTIRKDRFRIENQLVFNERMVPSILQMYVGREINYMQISYHRTLRIAETTLKTVLDIVMDEYLKRLESIIGDEDKIAQNILKILFHFKLMEDRDFLNFLEIMINLSPVAKNLFNRLLSRTLYKGYGFFQSINSNEISYPKTKTEILKNQNLLLHLPTNFWDHLIEKKNLNFFTFWETAFTKDIKDEVKEISALLENEKDEVILINAFNYPLDESDINTKLSQKIEDIHIYNEDNISNDAKIYLSTDMGKQLLSLLEQLHINNSNIIFAFEKSVLNKIKKKYETKVFSKKTIEALIFLALDYNQVY